MKPFRKKKNQGSVPFFVKQNIFTVNSREHPRGGGGGVQALFTSCSHGRGGGQKVAYFCSRDKWTTPN